eukprot:5526144-Amphidinium_carterae.1
MSGKGWGDVCPPDTQSQDMRKTCEDTKGTKAGPTESGRCASDAKLLKVGAVSYQRTHKNS